MALRSLNCPNCGASYNPKSYTCEYCGSFIITTKEKYADLTQKTIEIKKVRDDRYPGVYVFGRLMGQGEKPLVLGMANYFTGATSAGGKLLLTSESLCFSAHAINVGKKEAVIKLDEVKSVELGTNFLISQEILVSTPSATHKFVVFHGSDWVAKIKEAVSNRLPKIDESPSADYTE